MPADIPHPLFARFFDRFSRVIESELGRYRDQVLEGLTGRVLELGPGNGINFSHYPATVDEVIAIEPEPYLRQRALVAAEQTPVTVSVRAGSGDELGLDDESVDAAVASLVLCSVPDQATALAELRRVLKPGGQLRFIEHVQASRPSKARVQHALDATVWPPMAGGCHCGRDTVSAMEAAGFSIDWVKSIDVGPGWSITNPHVVGSAFVSAVAGHP